MSTGTVTTVTTDWRGDTLTVSAGTGDAALQVSSVIDFDPDGGWLVVGDSDPLEYVSVDEDADTIALAGSLPLLVTPYEVGLPVNVWDPTVANGGAPVVEYVATVELHDNTGTPDAVIPHALIPTAGVDYLTGATVRLEDTADGDWRVAEVLGREPVLDRGLLQVPLISLTLPANQTIPDSTTTTINGWGGVDGTIGGSYRRLMPDLTVRGGADGVDITAPGAYLAIVTIDWANNSSGGRTANLVLSRGGVDIDTTQAAGPPAAGGRSTQQVSRLFVAEGDETLKVTVGQSSGGSLDVRTNLTNLQVLQVATA